MFVRQIHKLKQTGNVLDSPAGEVTLIRLVILMYPTAPLC